MCGVYVVCGVGGVPPVFFTTAREFQKCTFEGPAFQTPPKFHEKTPREMQKERKWRRERKKKARHFGPPTLRGPTLRGSNLSGTHHDTHTDPSGLAKSGLNQIGLAKSGLAKNGLAKNGLAKNGLAKNGLAKNGFGQKWDLAKSKMAKNGLAQIRVAKIGQIRMAKTGLAKVGPFTRHPENSKRAHLRVPAFKNTTKIPREDTQRETIRAKMEAGEGKKERNFGRSSAGRSGAGESGGGENLRVQNNHTRTNTLTTTH